MAQTFEMMRCDRRNMTLSRPGCAKLWLSANTGEKDRRPKPWEGRAACVACPLGATNAGVEQSPVAGAVESIRMICPRCERPAQRLIHDRLCVSCYNREREALIGKNAKGGRPRLCDVLHQESVVVVERGIARLVRVGPVTSAAEVVIGLSRRASCPPLFGRPPTHPRSPQLLLMVPAFVAPALPSALPIAWRARRGALWPARGPAIQLVLDIAA